jgi:hypothetical protein
VRDIRELNNTSSSLLTVKSDTVRNTCNSDIIDPVPLIFMIPSDLKINILQLIVAVVADETSNTLIIMSLVKRR